MAPSGNSFKKEPKPSAAKVPTMTKEASISTGGKGPNTKKTARITTGGKAGTKKYTKKFSWEYLPIFDNYHPDWEKLTPNLNFRQRTKSEPGSGLTDPSENHPKVKEEKALVIDLTMSNDEDEEAINDKDSLVNDKDLLVVDLTIMKTTEDAEAI